MICNKLDSRFYMKQFYIFTWKFKTKYYWFLENFIALALSSVYTHVSRHCVSQCMVSGHLHWNTLGFLLKGRFWDHLWWWDSGIRILKCTPSFNVNTENWQWTGRVDHTLILWLVRGFKKKEKEKLTRAVLFFFFPISTPFKSFSSLLH